MIELILFWLRGVRALDSLEIKFVRREVALSEGLDSVNQNLISYVQSVRTDYRLLELQ
jgi:hypothetical protein